MSFPSQPQSYLSTKLNSLIFHSSLIRLFELFESISGFDPFSPSEGNQILNTFTSRNFSSSRTLARKINKCRGTIFKAAKSVNFPIDDSGDPSRISIAARLSWVDMVNPLCPRVLLEVSSPRVRKIPSGKGFLEECKSLLSQIIGKGNSHRLLASP